MHHQVVLVEVQPSLNISVLSVLLFLGYQLFQCCLLYDNVLCLWTLATQAGNADHISDLRSELGNQLAIKSQNLGLRSTN